jgi:hypothetical protein
VTRCLKKRLPLQKRQKVIDENRSLNQSIYVLPQPARYAMDSWAVMRWKTWPTCVESAETFIGGKKRNQHGPHNRKSGPTNKTEIIGAVERKGNVVARVI